MECFQLYHDIFYYLTFCGNLQRSDVEATQNVHHKKLASIINVSIHVQRTWNVVYLVRNVKFQIMLQCVLKSANVKNTLIVQLMQFAMDVTALLVRQIKFQLNFLSKFLNFSNSIEHSVVPSQCEHCQPGYQCDPSTGACIKGKKVVPEFLSWLQLASIASFSKLLSKKNTKLRNFKKQKRKTQNTSKII